MSSLMFIFTFFNSPILHHNAAPSASVSEFALRRFRQARLPALRNALVAVDAVFDGFAKANAEAMQEVAPPGTSFSNGE